jgi:hypothetical protein
MAKNKNVEMGKIIFFIFLFPFLLFSNVSFAQLDAGFIQKLKK